MAVECPAISLKYFILIGLTASTPPFLNYLVAFESPHFATEYQADCILSPILVALSESLEYQQEYSFTLHGFYQMEKWYLLSHCFNQSVDYR